VEAIRSHADALGARVTHVLVTHADWDHVCGLAAFPEAVAAMGPLTAEALGRPAFGDEVAERARELDVMAPGPRPADRVLEPGRAHRVGPFVVETLPLAGHTPDGTAYRIRALDLLAVGDHLSPVEFPFAASTAAYRATLAALVDLLRHDPPQAVYPGHGPPLDAAEALAVAEADLAYLHALRDAAASGGRAAALAVGLPRRAPPDLAEARESNVDAQLDELLPPDDAVRAGP
jgi:glyoxylase-like metal-dependent hydrolase (beta-lactamase superfamily II)